MFRVGYSRQRSYSETNLYDVSDPSSLHRSFMNVSHTTVHVGEAVTLEWCIAVPSSANDWIGLFDVDDISVDSFLDFKSRGVNGTRQGTIAWTMKEDYLERSMNNLLLQNSRSDCLLLCLSICRTITEMFVPVHLWTLW
jgi:hypothetical protein